MFNIITWQLYTVHASHHQKSSFPLSPYISPSSHPRPSGDHQSVVYIYEFVFVLFLALYSTCEWNYVILSFSGFISLSVIPSGSIHVVTMAVFHLLLRWSSTGLCVCVCLHIYVCICVYVCVYMHIYILYIYVYVYVYISHFLIHSSVYGHRLFPYFGYCTLWL